MSMITRERRTVAVLASLVLSLFTLFGLSSAAMATTGNPTGGIMSTSGTINVYKHANPGGALEYGNGNGVPAEGEALGGVPFTLYKMESVNLVGGSAGQDVVEGITDPAKPVEPALDNQNSPTKVTIDGKKHTLKKIDEKTIADGTGLAQLIDVYPGLYTVVGSKASFLPNSVIVVKAAPSFITLPIKGIKGAWSYTTNVYLKDTMSPKSEESAEAKNAADGVTTWTVKQILPTFDDTNKLTEFRFEGDLSGAGDTKGTFVSVRITVNRGSRMGDFNKELVGLDDKHLVITAKNSGDLPSSGKIVTTHTARASGNDQFRSGILSFISDVKAGHTLALADLGKITTERLDAADKTLYLSDAEFKVCVGKDRVEEAKDCFTVGTITTEKFLRTGSFDKPKVQKYILFETTAPAGYTFNPNTPYKADLTIATCNTVTLTIENMKTNVPTLPLMGVDGQLLIAIGGVALIPLAGGVFLVARKKHSEKRTFECDASLT